jgi:polyisoprenoid-binding protein YceI
MKPQSLVQPRRIARLTALVVLAGLCGSSLTGGSRIRAAEPEQPQLAAGDVDPGASRVYVRVGKRRLGHEHGVEGRVKSGRLILDATDSAGQVVFDMKSFQADTDAARKYVGLEGSTDADEQKDVTATMTGKGVLDVAKFPTATFAIKSSKRKADTGNDAATRYELVGEFDLHGKKQPCNSASSAPSFPTSVSSKS